MIPIKLTIKGLYSYREQVEIDFEKLAEGHLFGIFGAVGSGKSAILEAITFVLYGDTERLNANDNRNYNMMNLQSQQMLIELEFKVGFGGDEERFFAKVAQKRTSKFGKVETVSRNYSQWIDGDWKLLKVKNAEPILKLSYENFIKTIIIPQGKFQDFLHMSATDRTRMLREIFVLDRFELSAQVGMLSRDTNARLDVLKGQLMSLAEANVDDISAKDAQLGEMAMDLEKRRAESLDWEQKVADHLQLKKIAEDTVLIQGKLDQLAMQKEGFEAREAAADQYQKAVFHFRELTNQAAKLDKDMASAEAAFAKISTELAGLAAQLELAQRQAQQAKSAHEGKANIEAQIKDCMHLQEIRTASDLLAVMEERIRNGDVEVVKVAAKLKEAEAAKTKCEETIAFHRKKLPDTAKVSAALLWYQQRQGHLTQSARISAQILQTQQEQATLIAEQGRIAQDHGIALSAETTLVAALQAVVYSAKEAISSARSEKDHIAQQEGLATFALELAPGQPCPLCGATHHPSPYDPGEAAAKIRAADAKLKALETQLSAAEKALSASQSLAVRLDEKEKQLRQHSAEQATQQALLTAHMRNFVWAPYDPNDATQAEADSAAATTFQQTIDQEEKNRAELEHALKKLQEDQKKFEAALSKLREDKSGLAGQRDTHLRQLAVLVGPEYRAQSVAALKALSKELETQLEEIVRAFQTTQEAERSLAMKQVEWQQKQIAAQAEQQKLAGEWAENQAALAQKLAQSSHNNLDEVKAILSWNLDLEAEQNAVSSYKGQVQSAQMAIELLRSKADGRQHDAAAHANAEAEWVTTKQHIEQLQEAISLLRAALERLRADLEKRKALENDQSALQKRLDNLKVLEGMFKGSGFVKYVSTIYLQDLVARADVRFRKLTRNALSLELSDDSDFLVRDMLNGGQTRSVKTLSGGQTFQASLCLALALADNVQQHSGSSHNFFFLDEGFGTLDKESLGAVFDALKQLRQENRIVGVISHVEELQQEIELHLKVWQTEERGSLVKGSWE